jgi:hypothetical protein
MAAASSAAARQREIAARARAVRGRREFVIIGESVHAIMGRAPLARSDREGLPTCSTRSLASPPSITASAQVGRGAHAKFAWKFAEMIERHWDGITAYCKPENKVALGFVEGLKNISASSSGAPTAYATRNTCD